MTSRTQPSGSKVTEETVSFRPTNLRSSLRRKVSSIFGKRPSSCNFDQLSSGYNDGSLSASSQSLYSGPHAASPSLDAFLESIFNNDSHSEVDLNHTENLGSLLQPNNVCLIPSADGTAHQSVPLKKKEDGKAKDFKSYLKKVAIRRKEKISSSISNLSNKIKEKNLLRRESSFVSHITGFNRSGTNHEDTANGFVQRRRNTHASVEDGHFRRSNFRWSCNIPSDVNFCSFLPLAESLNDDNERDPTFSRSSYLEPIRHIDSSSEDDYSSAGTETADIFRPGCYTCSNHSAPVQPFARARSAIIQRNRRKVVSYQFEPSIDDFINDLHDISQPIANVEEPQCTSSNQPYMQPDSYPDQDGYNSCNQGPEEIYSNWEVYMDHKRSINSVPDVRKTCIYDEGYEYSNFGQLQDEYEYSDVESIVKDSILLCDEEEPNDLEKKLFPQKEYTHVPKSLLSIPPQACDPRRLELFEQTIPEEDDSFDDTHPDINLQITVVENKPSVPPVLDIGAEMIADEMYAVSCDDSYYQKVERNSIVFSELEIGKKFLCGRITATRSLIDVRKVFNCGTTNVYLSLGNVTLNCQEVSCIINTANDASVDKAKSKVKKRRRRRKNRSRNREATAKKMDRPVKNSAGSDHKIDNAYFSVNTDEVRCAISKSKKGKRRNRKRRNKRKNIQHSRKEDDFTGSYASEQLRNNEIQQFDMKSFPNSVCNESKKCYSLSDSLVPSDFQLAFLNTLITPCHDSSSLLDLTKCCDNFPELCVASKDADDRVADPVDNVPSLFNIQDHNEGVSWILTEGEEFLSNLQYPAGTLTGITKQVEDINEFYKYAKDKVEQTLGLLQGDLADPEQTEKCQEELTKALTHHLASFGDKLNLSKDNLEDTAKCYLLLDKAYEWALRAMKVVGALKATGVASPEQVSLAAKSVSTYLEENPPVPLDAFEAMIAIATKLDNQTLLQQCKVAQSRCCDTLSLLKNRHAALIKARRQVEFDCQSFVDLREIMGGVEDFSPLSWLSNSTLNNSGRRKSVTSLSSRSRDPLSRCSSLDTEEDVDFCDPQLTSTPISNKQTLESRTSLGNIKELRESAEDLQGSSSTSVKSATHSQISCPPNSSSGPAFSSGSSSCSSSESFGPLPTDRLLNKSPSWQYHNASSQVSQECPHILLEECLMPLSTFSNKSYPPSTTNSHLLIRGSQINLSNTEDLTDEEIKRNKTLLLIMQELKQTEKDYVNSLEYIIENYIPELMREDIPQALRGQRNVIFGNLEKIFEFHSNYLIRELESCQKRPFSVGSVFLKFEKQFYLYALYNKNKPKSDGLMAEYGSSFFKSKQLELGDKMDLSSYLLKPVQRMGKYALLLKQLLKECSRGEEDHEDLTAAQEMVQFQLRHGNDLLAMDSLRDCDVNLKEQGRLLRQGELTVFEGNRRKSIRHVFLFEDLILFSKSRRDPDKKNLEIFQYKCSMKMTDIGMTEQVGESSNRFEIWFRKRKPGDTYVLQATTIDLKESWTEVISKVLWRQALKNRSQRLHEMSSMGIGNKPCLDIRPSEDQICERSVCINQRGSARFKPTIPYMESAPSRRPHSVISIASSGSTGASSSNSSSTGPTFAGTLNLGFEPGDSPRPLTRSVTRTSQCSAESGIMADIYSEKETSERHYKVERSNSSVTTISGDSVLSPATTLVSHVSTSSTYVNAIPHPSESCQLVKDRGTGSVLTTEV